MSRLYPRLTRSRRSTNSCSSAFEVANSMVSSAYQQFMIILPPVCSPPWNPSRVSLVTISARMLNKYGERTQPCRTPMSTRNHSDSVFATLTLTSCFLYSLASMSIKCRGYPMYITVTQSLSWETESNALCNSILRFVIWSPVPLSCRNPTCSSAISVLVFTQSLSSMIRRRILLAQERRAIVL